jgi:hypothetical protein
MILPFVLPKKKEEIGRFFSEDDPFMADFFKPRYFYLFCTYKVQLLVDLRGKNEKLTSEEILKFLSTAKVQKIE